MQLIGYLMLDRYCFITNVQMLLNVHCTCANVFCQQRSGK